MLNDVKSGRQGMPFDLPGLLSGQTVAHGIFQDRAGRVRRRFVVDIDGSWDGPEFVLTERFRYSDGASETREWRVRPGENGRFTATTADCVGIAQGEADGETIRMRYDFRLQLKTRSLVVSFDDQIFPFSDGIAINRAVVRKWGVKIGEVTLVFSRRNVATSRQVAA